MGWNSRRREILAGKIRKGHSPFWTYLAIFIVIGIIILFLVAIN